MTAKEGLNIAQLMKAENIHTQRNHCAVCCKNKQNKNKQKNKLELSAQLFKLQKNTESK